MSLEALAVALAANMAPEASLVLIHLADGASDKHVTVPFLPLLARKVGIDDDQLRTILDELVADGIITPVRKHPFDFLAQTEGFRLNLEEISIIEHIESPWSTMLRVCRDTEELADRVRKAGKSTQ